jgi:hypothetical protein
MLAANDSKGLGGDNKFSLSKLIQHGEKLINDEEFALGCVFPDPADSNECLSKMVDVFCKGDKDNMPSCMVACGSVKLKEGADALYRLLWAFAPNQVDFSNMFGDIILFAATKCGRFGIKMWFHKYEPSLTFYCNGKYIKDTTSSGFPGFNNGLNCKSDLGVRFFEYVKLIATSKQEIYAGNDFSV